MRPFTAPISERNRQKYGVYQPRYEKESSMRAFTAHVSDYKREKFGEYEPRHVEKPSMRPFDADISERSRELYGDFQPRYETDPSMSAFDSELGSYKRDLFGDYRPKHSTIKVSDDADLTGDANGNNWVDLTWDLPWYKIINPDYDISIYQYHAFKIGGWAGVPYWRMLINDVKVYPFPLYELLDTTSTIHSFGALSIKLRLDDALKVQMFSSAAGDGAGKSAHITLNYVSWEP